MTSLVVDFAALPPHDCSSPVCFFRFKKTERTRDRHWHEFNGEFQQHVIGKVVGYYIAV